MSPLMQRKLRFADAVYAIEATPKSLRLWLQRDLVRLVPPFDPAEGWRAFSYRDIATLTIIRRLVDFGLAVTTASDIANEVLDRKFKALWTYRNAPPETIAAGFATHALVVWPAGEAWQYSLVMPGFEAPGPVYLTLHLAPLILDAINRAEESAGDGADDE